MASRSRLPVDLPDDIELELVASTAEPADATEPLPPSPAGPLTFAGELWTWRGPAPYHFITVPPPQASAIAAVAAAVTYGWGMIPVTVRIGGSTWDTALWPKDGGYVLPVKDRYRAAEHLVLGDVVAVELTVRR